ncbi:phosphopantetheine-binding protein [Streptomyces sp. Z26]|uniref:acyl carrier protein n=1 Tax=Streptomyces sp. Z26 TaxID=2500177 RepID=UPI001404A44C|nr:phosphopantetheine-binding protein [Streptomyces sp. Z26]
MDRREIADIVRARIGELLDHPRTIEEGDILSHHGLNSLLGVELTLRVEEEFDIAFEDDELNVENFETLRNITDLVAGKVAVRG